MPCMNRPNATPVQQKKMTDAVKRLEALLGAGVTVVIGATGGIAFKGWTDREGVSDLCAYRKLMSENSPALRKAVARAEVMAGRGVDQQALAAGLHSHDGGRTWGKH